MKTAVLFIFLVTCAGVAGVVAMRKQPTYAVQKAQTELALERIAYKLAKIQDARSHIGDTRQQKMFRGYIISGGLAAGVCVVILAAAGMAAKLIFSSGEVLVSMINAGRKTLTKEELLTLRAFTSYDQEALRLERAQMKSLGTHAIDIESSEVKATSFPCPDMSHVQDRMRPGQAFLGVNQDDGGSEYLDYKKVRGIATGGDSGEGKTVSMVNVLIQIIAQGGMALIVDFHYSDEDSLVYRLGDFATSPNVAYCDEPEELAAFLTRIEKILDSRLKKKMLKNGLICVVVDELIQVCEHYPKAEKVFRRIEQEGRKADMLAMAGAQNWKSTVIDTATRDQLQYKILHYMEATQAATYCKIRPKIIEPHIERLAALGEASKGVAMHKTKRGFTCVKTPAYSLQAVNALAGSLIENQIPDVEVTEQDIIDCGNVIEWDFRSGRNDVEIIAGICDMIKAGTKKKDIAAKAGIEPQHLNRILAGKVEKLQDRTRQGLLRVANG